MASKTCDEIWKIVRVKVSAQNMRDPMAAHTGFDEVHQGVRTTIQQNIMIRAHQIAGSGSGAHSYGTQEWQAVWLTSRHTNL